LKEESEINEKREGKCVEERRNGANLDQISNVQRHFMNLSLVILFDVLQVALVTSGDEVDGRTLTTETTRTTNSTKKQKKRFN
jgi:hypothetical protein